MNEVPENRRLHRRALFTFEDDIQGVFSIPANGGRPITTHILNLSAGGIHITLNPQDEDRFNQGLKLVLIQIKGPDPLQYVINVDAKVKWVISHEIMEHGGAGCEFHNISKSSHDQITSFVESWYEEDTQEQ